MFKLMKSESLKYKRSFVRKIIVIGPCFFALYGIAVNFLVGGESKYFSQSVYNWWSFLLLPLGIALMSVIANNRERKSGNYKNVYLYNVNTKSMWFAKVLVTAFYTLISSVLLALVAVGVSYYIQDTTVPVSKMFEGALMCWLANLIFIPCYLFLATLSGTALTIILGVIGSMAGVIVAPTSSWIYIPWSWGIRLMCPIIGVHPNGIALSSNDPLLNADIIFTAVILSIVGFIICSALTSVWFSKREVR